MNPTFILTLIFFGCDGSTFNHYTKEDLHGFREEVRAMFQHAYDGYLAHAYPYDELRPLSCDGVDTWGSYSLTLIDALDTLAVMGNYSEFRRVYQLLVDKPPDFSANINVSVFETNIRIVGGLLSAHLMARRAGVTDLPQGWPCEGPLLSLAEEAASKLLPAFDTPTGMPYGTVNLLTGVPEGETPVTCTAAVGTFVVEFGSLSRLTGNPVYEEAAMRAMWALWHSRSEIGLLGNHIDVLKNRWTAVEAGIGAGVDSYYEYLVKGAVLLERPELMHMFKTSREAVEEYLTKDDWHFWVMMKNGQLTMPLFQSLEAFWPGLLSMVGDIENGLKSLHNYHQVWKQYGFTPEFYNVAQGGAAVNREGYPLRPELIESIMYLYRATGDPWLIDAGLDILRSIQHSTKTKCGYATVKNVLTHTLADRMESFFLAETTKYLYLLFDTENFIHNRGNKAEVVETSHGKCVLDAGGYIFNTEAHPIDPAALACCSSLSEKEIMEHLSNHMIDILNPGKINQFKGDLIPERMKKMEEKRIQEAKERKEREKLARRKVEEMRIKAQEAAEEQKRLQEEKRQQAAAAKVDYTNSSDDNHNSESDEGNDTEKNSGDSAEQAEEDADAEEDEPSFSDRVEPPVEESIEGGSKSMITKVSRGEILEDRPLHQGSIIQPAEMKNIFEKKGNLLVKAINNLMDKFIMEPEPTEFDSEEFAKRLKTQRYPVNESWLSDFQVMSCPATKFTDRFLIHGEFFKEKND